MQWLMHVSTCLSSFFTAYGVDELLRCFVLPFIVLPCFVLPFLRPSLVPTEKAALAGVGAVAARAGPTGSAAAAAAAAAADTVTTAGAVSASIFTRHLPNTSAGTGRQSARVARAVACAWRARTKSENSGLSAAASVWVGLSVLVSARSVSQCDICDVIATSVPHHRSRTVTGSTPRARSTTSAGRRGAAVSACEPRASAEGAYRCE